MGSDLFPWWSYIQPPKSRVSFAFAIHMVRLPKSYCLPFRLLHEMAFLEISIGSMLLQRLPLEYGLAIWDWGLRIWWLDFGDITIENTRFP